MLKIIIALILSFLGVFGVSFYLGYKNTPKGDKKRIGAKNKRKNIVLDLIWNLPKQMGADKARKNINDFPEQGIIVFEGRQGSGKTISMIEKATELIEKYPQLQVASNCKYEKSQQTLKNSLDMFKLSNGRKGTLILLDEVQVWFNSRNSKNLDESATQYFTTCRKNTRLILGTAQNFYMLSKDLRTQTKLCIKCYTIGALTIQVKREPIIDSMGELKELKFKGINYFIHTDELRNSYDTSEMINVLTKNGLKERINRLNYNNQQID